MNTNGSDHGVARVPQNQQETLDVLEGLRLVTAFQNIANLTDRGILIELAERLASRNTSRVGAS